MKIVFVDAEYTGEHAYTTLVSIGLVTLDGDELYVTLDDYDRDQVTDWLRDNVLSLIDESRSVPGKEAYERVSSWLDAHADGERISICSAGLGPDILLLFELYHHACPERRYFHALHCLPPYLNHAHHLDLNTLFLGAGIDPEADRDAFAGVTVPGRRHDAIHDALVVRECFLKLARDDLLPPALACARR
jgi:DNA polymerase III epsilon subunit-like protein